MTLTATVLEVLNNRLLVRDSSNDQEILVNFRGSGRFSAGDNIIITFNGQMTHSIPPQITASSIQRVPNPAPVPPPQSTLSEITATILRREQDSLLVREIGRNRRFIVDYPYAYHFCVGQRIGVQYETIFLNESPASSRIIAVDITPFC